MEVVGEEGGCGESIAGNEGQVIEATCQSSRGSQNKPAVGEEGGIDHEQACVNGGHTRAHVCRYQGYPKANVQSTTDQALRSWGFLVHQSPE